MLGPFDERSLTLDDRSYKLTAYLRVSSLAVALYDFISTLPSSWRFYKEQWDAPRLTVSFILFFLIQFISIAALTISNVGFFYSHFTETSCHHFYLLPLIFKVLQAMVSQAILGFRSFNLSRRSQRISVLLASFYVGACTLEWITTLYNRQPVVDPKYGNCRAVLENLYFGAWIYYVVAMIYDLFTTSIAITYLLKHKLSTPTTSLFSQLNKIMLYDGIGYFAALTAVNILNLIIYRAGQDIQSAAASLGYCVTWIMSQRLLIHLHDASLERRFGSIDEAVTISQGVSSARDVTRIIRSQFDSKTGLVSLDLTIPDFELESSDCGTFEHADEVSVQVRVEKTVKVERRPKTYTLENYSRHPPV
ncbi:hypothetical protein D9758_008497 [Tetrapyrgos nigripes]|uniref:Uncharacterized protein n=1 Tax=Tetrapyrgos nigripes TaxID=182062 RepID=A0A8H5CPJ9_9AGAR|nr:hypothetical protein D9758_008497 [Tetrapyrgos nigripes]